MFTRKLSAPNCLVPGLMALTLAAGACTGDDPGTNAGGTQGGTVNIDTGDINLTAGLDTYQSCDALLARLKEEGLERVGPYGFDQGWWGPMPLEGEVMEDAATDTAAGAPATTTADRQASDEGSAGGFSGTNNQETGVDEADLVKTDGTRMVIATGNKLRVVDLTTNELVREIELGDTYWGGGELFLAGDSAILMTQGWSEQGFATRDALLPQGVSTTTIAEVDLNSGDIVATLEFEGGYLSARDIDGTVRVVLWAGMGNLPFLYPSNPGTEDKATESNRAVIEESTIEQWLPSFRLTEGGTQTNSGSLIPCDAMFVPGEFSGFGSLTVLTIDAAQGLRPVDAVGVLSDGQTVYSSTNRLAVATARWPEVNEQGEPIQDESFHTLVHSFDITNPSQTTYVASGTVDGHMLSQYSLSEHNGYLRVATTAGSPWWGGRETSESFITVLAENGSSLDPVGKVGGMGEGEQIQSVRFMGDLAYVVTFRQTDPLYAVDLTDPANPTVLGQLKIPGFSAYLHPLDDGLLLGIGQDATEQGQTTGSQVSLFDVSDPTNPQRISTLDLGSQAYSTVEWDARAFTWWDPTDTAFIPVSWYRWDDQTGAEENGTASVAVNVVDRTLIETGRISHDSTRQCDEPYLDAPMPVEPRPADDEPATTEPPPTDQPVDAEAEFVEPEPATTIAGDAIAPVEPYCWSWAPEIRRTVIANDHVYTVSEAGVMVSDLATLQPIRWLAFQA